MMALKLRKNSWFCIVLLGIILSSCDRNIRYENFVKVDGQLWDYKNILDFSIPVENEENLSVSVAVRNTNEYQNANLWLFVSLYAPSGKVLQDTLNCRLADDYGYWLGSGFSGLYLTEHSLERVIPFNEKGNWKIRITHGMRTDSIKGVKEVGVLIKKKEK